MSTFAISRTTSRMLLRRPATARFAASTPRNVLLRNGARFESTAASAAKDTAKSAAENAKTAAQSAKAADLSKQAQAGIAMAQEYSKQAAAGIAKAGASAQAMTKKLSQSGGTVGKVMGAVDKQIPFVVYWGRVAVEMAKLVSQARQISSPPVPILKSWFDALMKPKNYKSYLDQGVATLKNIKTTPSKNYEKEINALVLFIECLGFYTVGQMIGRFKIVGYRGKVDDGGHH